MNSSLSVNQSFNSNNYEYAISLIENTSFCLKEECFLRCSLITSAMKDDRPFRCSERESESNDIFMLFEKILNVHYSDRLTRFRPLFSCTFLFVDISWSKGTHNFSLKKLTHSRPA